MRPIHLAQLDKERPVLILTRELVRPHLTRVTVAAITRTVRGLSTEVPVGTVNGLDYESVVSCDNALITARRTQLQNMAQNGDRGAEAARVLAKIQPLSFNHPDRHYVHKHHEWDHRRGGARAPPGRMD